MNRLLAFLLLCFALPGLAAELPQKTVSIEGVTEYRLANGLRLQAERSAQQQRAERGDQGFEHFFSMGRG